LAALGDSSAASRFVASDIFAALATVHPEFAGMSYDTLGMRGALVAGATAEATT
jgi:predicted molibdopterin-dependent oxidoreductase YjgC